MSDAAPETIGCTIRPLPPELVVEAAKVACDTYLANAPPLAQFASTIPGMGSDMIYDPLRIAAITDRYWGPKPRTIPVQFMDGPDSQTISMILQYANIWDCGVVFVHTAGPGVVRIARGAGGYWSYLGTDVKMIPPGSPTMNLQGFTARTPISEYKRVVTHEFGHTLGFPHEHMREALVARLDREKTYVYFGRTQGWSRRDVELQVLTPLSEVSVMGTAPDDDSIMCYQLPGEITIDGRPIPGGDDANATDLAFADSIYPLAATPTPPVGPLPPAPAVALGPATSAEINRERAAAALPALAWSPALADLAAGWARTMADAGQLDHGNAGVRIAGVFPGRASGETIAAGQRTPPEVVAAWMSSAGHRRQLLGDYGLTGVGTADAANGTRYWCANFVAGSHDVEPTPPVVEPPPVIQPPDPPVEPPPPGEIMGPYDLPPGKESRSYRMGANQSFVFRVKGPRGGNYAAATRSQLDLVMDLYGSKSEVPIAHDDDSGQGANPLLSASLPRGSYTLLVKGATPATEGPFKIRMVPI